MRFGKISTSCWADPYANSVPITILNFFDYSPLVLEASILKDEDSIRKSSCQIAENIASAERESTELSIPKFLEKREEFLFRLRSVPAVESFVAFTIEKAEEARKVEEEIIQFLNGIGAKQEWQHEFSRVLRPLFKERSFLIRIIREALLSGDRDLGKSLTNYLKDFNDELGRLVAAKASPETIYTILMADVEFISMEKQLLRTSQSIAIPLDLSPLRLSLAQLVEREIFEQSSKYYPPLLLLFNPRAREFNLAKPYRTLDGHPTFVRAPSYESDRVRAQHEASDSRDNFEHKVGPLLHGLKGLAGTGDTVPSLIAEPIVRLALSYLSFNPFSKEMLRILDLGCGSGAMLKKTFVDLQQRCPPEEKVDVYALLSDDSHENPGSSFRRLSLEEQYGGLLSSGASKGDMRRLICELSNLNERFDIAFMNRVLDMYGGYGVFEFKLGPRRSDGSSSSYNENLMARDPNVGQVLAFSESACHEEAWRAVKYIFDRHAHQKEEGFYLLPAIDMKMKKNFFDFEGADTLDKLLTVAKLLVITVFPGSFGSLFSEVDSVGKDIFYAERSSKTSYSTILMSKNKQLVDHLMKQCPDFIAE